MIVNRAWHAKPVNNQISWQTRDFGRERNLYGFYNSVSVVWDFACFYILAQFNLSVKWSHQSSPSPRRWQKDDPARRATQATNQGNSPPPPPPRPKGNSTTRVN